MPWHTVSYNVVVCAGLFTVSVKVTTLSQPSGVWYVFENV